MKMRIGVIGLAPSLTGTSRIGNRMELTGNEVLYHALLDGAVLVEAVLQRRGLFVHIVEDGANSASCGYPVNRPRRPGSA